MDYVKISFFFLIVFIILIIFRSIRKTSTEGFIVHQPDIEQIGANRGLVFGYIPKDVDKPVDKNKNPNWIYNGDTVNIFSSNKYFGYSSKNQLLVSFLKRLGTFTPYTYESIKIICNDSPVKYGISKIQIGVKHSGEDYFLQFLKDTNTFYLTKKPSDFIIINSLDNNKETEVNYNDSILIKCLDNSEYLLVYEEFLISEKDKSSSFNIQKGEARDVCANFNTDRTDRFIPQLITPKQASDVTDKYKNEIEKHVNTLKTSKKGDVQKLQNNIKLLETKFNKIKGDARTN
jgi:hypothetical protein